MTDTVTDKLDKVVKAIEEMPEERRAAVIDDIEEDVAWYAASQMNEAHRNEVRRRLALLREQVPNAEIAALLKRFNPSLRTWSGRDPRPKI